MSRTIKINYTTFAIPDDWKQSELNTFIGLVSQLRNVENVYPDCKRHDKVSTYDFPTEYVWQPVILSVNTEPDAVYFQTKSAAQHDANKAYQLAVEILESSND